MKQTIVFILSAIIFLSCNNNQHKKAEVTLVIKNYERYILNMKTDSIAALFTPDGEMGEEGRELIHSRDSIRSFLATFSYIHVLENTLPVDEIRFDKDSAIATGSFTQTAVINHQDTVRVKGKFTARLLSNGENNWLIRKMTTRSE